MKTGASTPSRKMFAFAEVKAVDGGDFGGFVSTLSAPTLDRDDEIVDTGALDPLPQSIPILADHEGRVRSLVARATPYYDGDRLRVVGKFASHEFAQYVRGLVLEGMLDTMSIGFLTSQREVRDGVVHITKGELLEGSFVVIPSNRDALVEAAKSLHADEIEYPKDPRGILNVTGVSEKAGRRNSNKDQAALDSAHDAIVSAGANCPGVDTGDDDEEEKALAALIAADLVDLALDMDDLD